MPGNPTVVPASVRPRPPGVGPLALELLEHPGDLGTSPVRSVLKLSGRSGQTQLSRQGKDGLESDDGLLQDVALRAGPGRQPVEIGFGLRRETDLLDEFAYALDAVSKAGTFCGLTRRERDIRSPSGRGSGVACGVCRCSGIQETECRCHCCYRHRDIDDYVRPHSSRAPTRICDTPTFGS